MQIDIYCRRKGACFRTEIWKRFKETRIRDFLFIYPTGGYARSERRRRLKSCPTIPSEAILSSREFLDFFAPTRSPEFLVTTDLPFVIQWLLATGKLKLPMGFASKGDQPNLPFGILKRLAAEIEEAVYTTPSPNESGNESAQKMSQFYANIINILAESGLRYLDAEIARLWREAVSNPAILWSNPLLKETRHIVFDSFWALSPALWGFIKCASKISPDHCSARNPTVLSVIFDYSPSKESALYPHLQAIWDQLCNEVGARVQCDGDNCHCTKAAFASPEIYRAPSIDDEITYVSRRMRVELKNLSQLQRESSPSCSVAVCFPNLSSAYPYVRRLFRDWGIMYRVPYLLRLTSTPLWDFFMRLENVVSPHKAGDTFLLSALNELLEHPWRSLLFPEWSRLDIRFFRRLQKRYAEQSDLESFLKWITSLSQETPGNHVSEEDALEQPSTERLAQLSESLTKVTAELKVFQGEHAAQEWYNLIYGRLSKALARLISDIHRTLEKPHAKSAREARILLGRTADDVRLVTECVARLIAHIRRYDRILKALTSPNSAPRATSAQAPVAGGAGAFTMTLRSYLDGLSLLIENENVADRVRILEGVEVISPAEAVGGRFHRLFFAGLVEGQMPSFGTSSFVRKGFGGLSPEEIELSQQRYIFRKSLRTAPKVVLSYAQHDGAVDLLPSQFIEELSLQQEDVKTDHKSLPEGRDRLKLLAESVRKIALKRSKVSPVASAPEATFPAHSLPLVRAIDQIVWNALAHSFLRAKVFTPFDGELAKVDYPPKSARERFINLAEDVFTAYQLQDLVECPLLFFFKRILGVLPPEREQLVWAIERGSLIHRILKEIIADLSNTRSRDELFTRLNEITFAELERRYPDDAIRRLSLALELLGWEPVFEKYKSGACGERELVGRISDFVASNTQNAVPGLLRLFLENEIKRNGHFENAQSSPAAAPESLEWRFGFHQDGTGPVELSAPPDITFKVRGVIDRIDRCPLEQKGFSVIDYKTGSSCPSKKDLESARAVQLPLYALAFERVDPKREQAIRLAYYHIRRNQIRFISVDIKRDSNGQRPVIDQTLTAVGKAIVLARDGHFYPLGAAPKSTKSPVCSLTKRECPYFLSCCRGCKDPYLRRKIQLHLK
ncbi:MAG: PD-(D/E)XK nuclease family protein [Candidatus Sumerlaeaceae bacterium]|nr:PD-(D/E)XK nuclease family protein [Candidatus Sumerlaeaceae bacterium]